MAEALVQLDVLPLLVASLDASTRHTKKAAANCLRAITRHSPTLAQTVVASGAIRPLISCLEDLDWSVREAAAWTLGYMASHEPDLAQQVVDARVIPPLVVCIQVGLESTMSACKGICMICKAVGTRGFSQEDSCFGTRRHRKAQLGTGTARRGCRRRSSCSSMDHIAIRSKTQTTGVSVKNCAFPIQNCGDIDRRLSSWRI